MQSLPEVVLAAINRVELRRQFTQVFNAVIVVVELALTLKLLILCFRIDEVALFNNNEKENAVDQLKLFSIKVSWFHDALGYLLPEVIIAQVTEKTVGKVEDGLFNGFAEVCPNT